MSNSDAHSPEKTAREANIIEAPLSYQGIFDAFRRKNVCRVVKTLEFFPDEGKYHADGHRKCRTRMMPQETVKHQGLCPKCGKAVTVGVLHRVEKLSDRKTGQKPQGAADFENIIPLKEILSEVLTVGPASVKVEEFYSRLLYLFGSELSILRELPLERLKSESFSLLARAIERMRQGRVSALAGYDGEYGKVSLLRKTNLSPEPKLSPF